MTVLEATVAQRRSSGRGGVAGRRAVTRWAWRMFRREWRQQIVVLALLTITMAAAIFAVIAAYNVTPSGSAKFGTADHRITLSSSDATKLAGEVAVLATKYTPTEQIWHADLQVPGSVETVDLRAQDTLGLYSTPLLAVTDGHYPVRQGEVAITKGVAATFGVGIGDQLSIQSSTWTVVGLVEDPAQLDDEFILTLPGDPLAVESVDLLIRGHNSELGRSANSIRSFETVDGVNGFSQSRGVAQRGPAVIGTLALDTMALLLVSLVAAAGFVVVAQRRLRQFGMLAAMGATRRQMRLVTIAHGLLAGLVSAALGTGIAVVSWFTASSSLESFANHRINRADIPWWLVVVSILLAVATTAAAAWWPARTTARVPVVTALSGRPARPKRAHRSALAALVFLAIGATCLVIGIDKKGNAAAVPIIAGPIAIVLGMLFLCPIAIRGLAAFAGRMPIAPRLALRDLARYQARAAAALAAISLGLGIAFTAIIVSTAAAPRPGSGNLSDRQLLIRLGDRDIVPAETPAQLAQLDTAIAQLAASIGGAVIYPLDAAIPSPEQIAESGEGLNLDPFGRQGIPTVGLGLRVPHGIQSVQSSLYVASPDLLARLGIDAATVHPSVDVITTETGDLVLTNLAMFKERIEPEAMPAAVVRTIDDPGFTDQPKTLLTESALQSHGWVRARAGWFIETDHAITAAQRAQARDLAVRSGLTIETRDPKRGLFVTRLVATTAGMLLALAILAMTIGLIRGEASRDLQTLTATGATSSVRRTLTAATAAALALLGALLGLLGAYIGLVAGYQDHLSPLVPIPLGNLLIVLIGLPAVAAAAAWLLGGREPPVIARRASD